MEERRFALTLVSNCKNREPQDARLCMPSFEEFCKSFNAHTNFNKATITSNEYTLLDKDAKRIIKGKSACVIAGMLKTNATNIDSDNLQSRSMLVYDIENKDDNTKTKNIPELVDSLNLNYLLHTTISDTLDNRRYRLYLPLSRDVNKWEFDTLYEHFSNIIGKDKLDSQCTDFCRLMYLPTDFTDKSTEIYYKTDRAFVDVEDILAYSHLIESIPSEIKEKPDPRTKNNLEGAWCRRFTFDDVFRMINEAKGKELYIKSEKQENRYTYSKGSGDDGIVILPNNYVYCHHESDKKLGDGHSHSSFEVYYYVMYGKTEGYEKMKEYIDENYPDIASEAKENQGLNSNLEGILFNLLDVKEDEDVKWRQVLEVDKQGKLKSTYQNIYTILTNDASLKDIAYYDVMRLEHRFAAKGNKIESVSDQFYNEIRTYINFKYNANVGTDFYNAVDGWLDIKSRNTLTEYFNALPEWDGIDRIKMFLDIYLNVDVTNPLNVNLFKYWLIGCVKRAFSTDQWNNKFESILILEGGQGLGKSTFLKRLATINEKSCLFTDARFSLKDDKDIFEKLSGNWIVELAEMGAVKHAKEVETVKELLSKTELTCRQAYKRKSERRLIKFAFAGTTNTKEILRDSENRRFFILSCGEVEDTVANAERISNILQCEIDQLWSQAYKFYRAGEKCYPTSAELALLHLEQEDNQYELDYLDYVNKLDEFLSKGATVGWDAELPHEKFDIFERYCGNRFYDKFDIVRTEMRINLTDFLDIVYTVAKRLREENHSKNIKISNADRDRYRDYLKTLGWEVKDKTRRINGESVRCIAKQLDPNRKVENNQTNSFPNINQAAMISIAELFGEEEGTTKIESKKGPIYDFSNPDYPTMKIMSLSDFTIEDCLTD